MAHLRSVIDCPLVAGVPPNHHCNVNIYSFWCHNEGKKKRTVKGGNY